ncbi:hypothetical protein HYH03_002068 [Edaphochlamys debaryana]|uniref:Uncharacterized protein n=1 Tax=Edaphochlamys debaryana TaxID=47281 RepID=A0A835YBX2_9CHLO|nr:hypothetical protein HYH03_002068 [Edaphochlamys debaryana]|eukprot:KAG2499771.1 hypothetical protein HYH03_002068 [Edaphochlamys debaryana]
MLSNQCHHLVPQRGPSHSSLASYGGSSPGASLPACSPVGSLGAFPAALGVAGASPPFRGGSTDKANPYLAAKKFWKRLCFDPALDPTEYTIGFIETVQQPERRSGVEAWSMRLHDRLMELPFSAFVDRFCGGGMGSGAATGAPSTPTAAQAAAAGAAAFGSGLPPQPQHPPRHSVSPSAAAVGVGMGAWAGGMSTSDEAGSDVPYHRIAYFKHGGAVVWESEYHKRRLSDLPAAPAPPPSQPSGCGASEGGATPASVARRRSSRDGMPPIPHPGPPPGAGPSGGSVSGPAGGTSAAAAANASPWWLMGSTPPSRGGGMGLLGTSPLASSAASGGGGLLGRSIGSAAGRAARGVSLGASDGSPSGLSSEDEGPAGPSGSASGAASGMESGQRRGGRAGRGGLGGPSAPSRGGSQATGVGTGADEDDPSELLLLGDDDDGDDGSSSSSDGEDDDGEEEAPTPGRREAELVRRLLGVGAAAMAGAGSMGRGGGGFSAGPAYAEGWAVEGEAAAAQEAPIPQLPEECWMAMLQQLGHEGGVREVCMAGRACRWLRTLASDASVWRAAHEGLWGRAPDATLPTAVVRRQCRRSQLRAARWLEAAVGAAPFPPPSTTCLQMDDSKVVSGDGNVVRLWSHATGRKIATLQGHPGRIASLAFDESLLASACAGGVLKLWSMDELKCRRTLRGHEGPVTSVCLLPTGIPVSGGVDGAVRLWDVGAGSPIVSLEAGAPVQALQAHGPSGHLVAAAGWGCQVWDVSTATLLQTLGEGDDAGLGLGGPVGGGPQQHPFTCVSYVGDLLAAGRQGEVVLMDPRVGSVVGRLRRGVGGGSGAAAAGLGSIASAAGGGAADGLFLGGDGGAFASGMGAIAAAAAATGAGAAGVGGGGRGAPCVGVQMDEWKLVCGFHDGRHQLQVYDVRSLPTTGPTVDGSGGSAAGVRRRRPWFEPLMTLTAPARINAFQFHEQQLLAGLEGADCLMWRFDNPNTAPSVAAAAAVPGAATAGAGAGRVQPGQAPGGGRWAGEAAGGAGGSTGGPGSLAAEGSFSEGGASRKEKRKSGKGAKKVQEDHKAGRHKANGMMRGQRGR